MFDSALCKTDVDWVMETLRLAPGVASLILAIVNICFAYYFFTSKDQKDDKLRGENLRLDWFKLLILQNHFNQLLQFFTDLSTGCSKLTDIGLSTEQKMRINEQILTLDSDFGRSFVELLRTVDPILYGEVLAIKDKLIDGLTTTMSDDNINLTRLSTFEEFVVRKISNARIEILGVLAKYRGGASH